MGAEAKIGQDCGLDIGFEREFHAHRGSEFGA
jgi:hypothetical protein